MCIFQFHRHFYNVSQFLSWLSLIITSSQILSSYAITVHFDNYGDCNRGSAFIADDEEFTVLSHGGDHHTLNCDLSFRSFKKDEELCLKFISLQIKDCSVRLFVYDRSSAAGDYMHMFSCEDEPKHLCSTGRYLTLKLKRPNVRTRKGYKFELIIKEKSQSDAFLDGGLDAFVMSIGLIIVIIVGVVVFIAITAVAMVCCCCKRKTNKRGVYRHKQGSEAEPFRPQGTAHPLQPTAPPLTDDVYQPPLQPGIQPHCLQGYPSSAVAAGQLGYPPLEQPPAYSIKPPQYTQQPT